MNFLYPKIRFAPLKAMLRYATVGAVFAGFYGVVHDQVTYSISPEYFMRLKFSRFRYADIGLPARAFVAEIGFLATWWVGFVAGWFMAGITVPTFAPTVRFRHTMRGFLIILAFALAASTAGYVLGILHGADYSAWEGLASTLGIVYLPGFVRVAYIHNASYLDGLAGLIAAIIYLRKLKPPKAVALPSSTKL